LSTPLIYGGLLYVLANNGVFDAYNLESGEEIYRQRLPETLRRLSGGRRQNLPDLPVEQRR